MSGINTSQFVSASYGTANFQVEEYHWQEEPLVKAGFGRTQTRITASIKGFIDAGNAAEFATKLASLTALSIDGLTLTLTGLGGAVERVIAGASCEEGGPHLGYQLLGSKAPFHRDIAVTVTATVPYNAPCNSYTFGVTTRPDGIRVFTQRGQIDGPDAAVYFVSGVQPTFSTTFGLPNYSVAFTYDSSSDPGQTRCVYTLTATQMESPLPSGGAVSVEGTATIKTDRDEQLRVTTTYSFNLLLSAASASGATALHNSLRPVPEYGLVIRESMSISSLREARLESSFVVLIGDSQSNLLTWTCQMDGTDDSDVYEEKTFPGAAPFAVEKPDHVSRVTISGEATGLQTFVAPPDNPGTDDNNILQAEPPHVSYSVDDNYIYRTRWTYVLIDDPDNPGDIANLDPTQILIRPKTPIFVGGLGNQGGGPLQLG